MRAEECLELDPIDLLCSRSAVFQLAVLWQRAGEERSTACSQWRATGRVSASMLGSIQIPRLALREGNARLAVLMAFVGIRSFFRRFLSQASCLLLWDLVPVHSTTSKHAVQSNRVNTYTRSGRLVIASHC